MKTTETMIEIPSYDLDLLRALVNRPPAGIPPPDLEGLKALLQQAHPCDAEACDDFVSLGCRVLLVSPEEPSDRYEFEPVMHAAEDLDQNRLSVVRPICRAVLGRPVGASVEWSLVNGSIRRMVLHEIGRVTASL